MSCRKKDPLTCHAERQRSIRGDGWLAGGPGRRPAAPLPTTQVRDWCVVGRGAAGLRPGTRGPPNVFVMACYEKVTATCHSSLRSESEVGHAARLVRPDASLPLSMTRQRVFFMACHASLRSA